MGSDHVEHVDCVMIVSKDSQLKLGMDREVVDEPLKGRDNSEGFEIEDLLRVSRYGMLKTYVQHGYPEGHAVRASITKNGELCISNKPFLRVQDMDAVRVLHLISKPNEFSAKQDTDPNELMRL